MRGLDMQDFEMKINEYLPLRDVVFNTLRSAILMGKLEPGERLMEIALANKLGVSRTPIREAIRKLELEGLVIMTPRKGAEVARITEKDLQDVLEVRESLEILATELACERITAEEIETLKVKNDEFREAVEGKTADFSELAELDVAFHDVIFNASKNSRLIQILNNLREQMYRYRLEYLKNAEYYDRLVNEHNQITEGVSKKDKQLVQKTMDKHIRHQRDAVIALIRQQEAEQEKKQ